MNTWEDLKDLTIQALVNTGMTWQQIQDLLVKVLTDEEAVTDELIKQITYGKTFGEDITFGELFDLNVIKGFNEQINSTDYIVKEVKKVLIENLELMDEVKIGRFIGNFEETITFGEVFNVWITRQVDLLDNVALDDIILIQNYIIREFDRIYILDKQQQKLAIVKEAWDIRIFEQLRGAYNISFKMKLDDASAEYITGAFYVSCRGRLFFITEYSEVMDNMGREILEVEGQHISFELQNFYLDDKFQQEKISQTPFNFLRFLTLFSIPILEFRRKFGGFDVDYTTKNYPSMPISFNGRNVLEFVQDLLRVFPQLEMIRDNYNIKIGDNLYKHKDIDFRYGKNIKGIRKSVDIRNLERYYVGKSFWNRDLTWQQISLEGRLGYFRNTYLQEYLIEAPEIDLLSVGLLKSEIIDETKIENLTFNEIIQDGNLRNPSIDDYVKGDALKDFILNSNPRIGYEIDLAELWHVNSIFEFEKFKVGDYVRVNGQEFQILEYEYYPYEPEKCKIKLSNLPFQYAELFTTEKKFATAYVDRDDVIIFTDLEKAQKNEKVEQYINNLITQKILEGKTILVATEEANSEYLAKYRLFMYKSIRSASAFIPVTTS